MISTAVRITDELKVHTSLIGSHMETVEAELIRRGKGVEFLG